MVNVRQGRRVDLVNVRLDYVLNASLVFLDLVMKTDGGQLVSRAQAGSRATNRAAHHRALRLMLVEVQ